MAKAELREMIPATRNAWSKWEVSYAGSVVGWVESRRIGHGRTVFYTAVGIAPDGSRVVLENSTDREERAAVVVAFHLDPEQFQGKHWHPRSARFNA